MRHVVTAALLLAGSAASVPEALAQGGTSPLLPPGANFRGTSYDAWNMLSSGWTIATGLGGQDLPDTVRGMRFLSGAFSPGEYEFEAEVRPGTGLVFPAFFVFGELYEDGSADDPATLADLIELIMDTTEIEVVVDGRVVQSGTGTELAAYQYGPEFYPAPIFYEEPQPRPGFPDAVAALWGVGVGAVFHPLSAGEHVIEVTVDSEVFGLFEYRYEIRVRPPGRK